MRFGRLPHFPTRVAQAQAHVYAAGTVPRSLDRSAIPFRPKLFANDRYGDCTFASATNSRRAQNWLRNGTDWVTDEAHVVASFAACAGIPNNDAALQSSPGLRMLDVIDYAQGRGIDMGNQTIEVPVASSVQATDRIGMAHAIGTGGGWIGVNLTQADIDALQNRAPLSGTPVGPTVAGHALMGWDYTGLRDTDTVRLATYDFFADADWAWLTSRTMEAYCLDWS